MTQTRSTIAFMESHGYTYNSKEDNYEKVKSDKSVFEELFGDMGDKSVFEKVFGKS